MRLLKTIILSLIILSVFFCLAEVISAQEISYPEIGGEDITSETGLPGYIKYIFNFVILLGTILAFAVLVYGGVCYLISGGSATLTSEAKSRMLSGIIGLFLLLSCYLVLTTINPELAIFQLEDLESPEEYEPPEYIPPEPTVKTYQEIPIGLLIENALAKSYNNISEESEEEIEEMASCYEYDGQGNIVDQDGDDEITENDLLKNHDRLDCLDKLLEAAEIKTEILANLSKDLKNSSEDLRIVSEELRNYADPDNPSPSCKCSNCNECCDSSSCGECTCNCQCNGEPCSPVRDRMNYLRNTTIPFIIERINEERDIIRAFVYGADPDLDEYNYDPFMDPEVTPTFLTFEQLISLLEELIEDSTQDLGYLEEAEGLMKYPYGQRLSQIEYISLKENTEATDFRGFDPTKYCREFNCKETEEGICTKYELNIEGNICNVFNLDSEPATFYFPEKEDTIFNQGKCIVDPVIEKEYAEMPKGKIPIGEAVDEAELFSQEIIGQKNSIYSELISAKDEALAIRDEAESQIEEAEELIELTSNGDNNTKD